MKLSELEQNKITVVSRPTLKLSEIDPSKISFPETEKKAGYFQRVGSAFQRAGQDVTTGIQEGAKQFQAGVSKGTFGGQVQATTGLLRSGLRTAGGVARAAFDPIIQAPIIKQATEFAVGKIASIPNVEKLIQTASEFSKKYPTASKDVQNIVEIAPLGYAPKAIGALSKEGRAIGSDIAQATKIALSPSEEVVQKGVIELFQKSIKPTAKKTLAQGQKYENDTLNALKTIKANVDNLNIEDDLGELVAGRTPQTINELSQALDQTKQLVFKQYDDLAKQAGQGGAFIDARPIANEVLGVAQNKALQITNPELIKYAEGWAERLNAVGTIDAVTTQEIVKTLNSSLSAFYKNPTYDAASKVAIDAGIANNLRIALDDAIQNATGKEYQALKSQYGALKAIENDVVKAASREARKSAKGLLDYTDIFTSGQMLSGILSLNPAMFTKGAVERGFKEYIKFLNDPNRAVGNMFELLDSSTVKPFVPTSATGKLITGEAKAGMSIQDVSGVKIGDKTFKAIDEATKKEMIEAIDYIRLKKPYDQNMENAIGRLAEKYNITDKKVGSVANKFEDLIENTQTLNAVQKLAVPPTNINPK
jgi:hypothetical protein